MVTVIFSGLRKKRKTCDLTGAQNKNCLTNTFSSWIRMFARVIRFWCTQVGCISCCISCCSLVRCIRFVLFYNSLITSYNDARLTKDILCSLSLRILQIPGSTIYRYSIRGVDTPYFFIRTTFTSSVFHVLWKYQQSS